MLYLRFLPLLYCLFLPVSAAPVTLDFDDPAVSGYNYCLEEGFQIKAAGRIRSELLSNGTRVIRVYSNLPPVTVSHIDGTPFSPLRIDLSENSIYARPPDDKVPVEGVRSDGHILSHSFTLDGQIGDTSGVMSDFQTFQFPSDWRDIVTLRFLVSGFAFDNVVLEGRSVPDAPEVALPNAIHDFQIEAELPASTYPWQQWQVHRVRGNEVLLAELSSRDAPVRYFHFPSGRLSPAEGPFPNPWTGERGEKSEENVPGFEEVYVPAFYLLPDLTDDSNRILLYKDQHPSAIKQVNLIEVEAGKMAFVSHWYNGVERYGVFLVSGGELIPVVKPDTVLPDGGLPFHFPYQLYLEDGAIAFPSSTSISSQSDCWFLKFPGQALILGIREGAVLPGQFEPVADIGKLLDLNQQRAIYYLHGATRSWLVETTREGGHRVLGASGPTLTGRPVNGCGMRFIAGGKVTNIDPVTGTASYGWKAQADESGASVDMHAAEFEGKLVPVCAGLHAFSGLSSPLCLFSDYSWGGISHSVIVDGTRTLLVKFRGEAEAIAPVLSNIVPMVDGSYRVMADYLTLDTPVTIETSNFLAGPWVASRVFQPGSISRSLPLPVGAAPAAFMRLRY